MNQAHAGHRQSGETLARGLLALARAVCIGIIVVSVAACVASIPAAVARFSSICTFANQGRCPDSQVNAQGARTLHALGISLQAYGIYTVVLMLFAAAIYLLVALFILWRRSDDWLSLFTAIFLVTFGIGANGFLNALSDTLTSQQMVWRVLLESVQAIGNVAIVLFFFLFPSGRFVPRWTMWVMLIWCLQIPAIFSPALQLPDLVTGPLFVAVVITMLAALIYRYRRVSTAIERQQTKWVVFGGVLTGATEVVLSVSLSVLESNGVPATPLLDTIANTAYILVPLAIPLSIGVAMLRYRLWDVDVIINRTLAYASLTAILAAIYVGSVIVLQSLVTAITGQDEPQPTVIVASTLAIAALFQPLRRRIQDGINRRFYRRAYDAEKTLAAFGATLRAEVDLAHLQDHLVATVEETMQPAHVFLLLNLPRGSNGPSSSASAE